MLKEYTVTYHYGNPCGNCGGGTEDVVVKVNHKGYAEAKAFKKKKPHERFVYSRVNYTGPKFVTVGLEIYKMPQTQHVATAVSHKAKRILLEAMNE